MLLESNEDYYFFNINYTPGFLQDYWNSIYKICSEKHRFHINTARRFGKNRFIPRIGSWPTPIPTQLAPGFDFPKEFENFNKNFTEVTTLRALEIKKLIQDSGARVAVFYSGGIDSVICLCALIQNLTRQELRHVDVCLSSESVIENPLFFEKHIRGQFKLLDSGTVSYKDIESAKNFAITCDQGDSIFGTEMATEIYYRYGLIPNEGHYSKYKDILIQYFNLHDQDGFGLQFYDNVVENIKTSPISIHSLHDFFWWIIFNLKYMDCALRGPIFYYKGMENRSQAVNRTVINWFHSDEYQKWSLANNNTGEKIKGISAATYKWAGRKYIHSFDKNDWFFRHKLKISSLINISRRNRNDPQVSNTFAMNKGFDLISLSDTRVQDAVKKLFSF